MTEECESPAGHAIYLYCLAGPECLPVIRQQTEQGQRGVDHRYPLSYLNSDDGIVAIVSVVEPAEFVEQNLQDLDWLAPRACRHEAVIDAIISSAPVLPVKFGAIFHSPDRLMQFLISERSHILALLEQLAGKSEWCVKGYLRDDIVQQQIVSNDEALQVMRASLPESPGLRYVREKQIGTLLQVKLQKWVDESVRDCVDLLCACTVDTAELRLLRLTVTATAGRMVLNRAFLIDQQNLPRFRNTLLALKSRYDADGLTLELDGPRAAYHFCPALHGDRRSWDALEEAV